MTPYRRVEIFTLSLYSFCALSQVSVSINEKKLLLKRKYHFNLKISGHYLRCDAIIQERLLMARLKHTKISNSSLELLLAVLICDRVI